MIIRNRIALIVVLSMYFMFLSIAYITYIDPPSHRAIVIEGYNGDIVFYDPSSQIIVAKGVEATLIVKGDNSSVALNRPLDKACSIGDKIYGVTEPAFKERRQLVLLDDKMVYTLETSPTMPEPRLLYCSDDTVVAVGGDIVRGIGIYLITGLTVKVYYIPFYEPILRDVVIYNNKVYILLNNYVLEAKLDGDMLKIKLSMEDAVLHLNKLQVLEGKIVVLGSIEYNESSKKRDGIIVYLDEGLMDVISVRGRNSGVELVTSNQGIERILVRPSGDWAKLLETSHGTLRGSVSVVMSESFVLTSSGTKGSTIWIAGRLPASDSMIIYEGSSTRPAYIGEGYYIVVEVKPYNKDLIDILYGQRISIESEYLGVILESFTINMQASPDIEVTPWDSYSIKVYTPYIDKTIILLTLISTSIPLIAILYRLLSGPLLELGRD